MYKLGLISTILMIMSISTYAEELVKSEDNTTQEESNTPIKIRSVRSILSAYDPVEYTKGQ